MIDDIMIDWNQVLSIVTVIATVVLTLVAYRSFKEVKRQADLMEKQSSLMHENMEYDRLMRRYDRLNKEIAELIGPLFSKKDNFLIFDSAGEYGSNTQYAIEYQMFWDNIREKIYLANKDLNSGLQNYFLAIEKYKNSGYNQHAEHSNEAKDEFKAEADRMIQQIEASYKNLQEKIRKVELELKIQ